MTVAEPGLLIFDLDGTLFNGNRATVGAVREVFAGIGAPPPPEEEIVTFYGKPTSEFQKWLNSLRPAGCEVDAGERVVIREVELIPEMGVLIEGVEEALRRFADAGHRMAICSNGRLPYINLALESRGILHYFEKIRWRRSPDDRKPDMVKELLDAIPARPAAVIGDRSDDIEAALENGIIAIGAGYGFGGRAELAGAHAVVEGAAELPGVVAKLFRASAEK